jgi:hypothetical protein
MNRVAKRAGTALADLILVLTFFSRLALAQGGGAPAAGRMTEEVFKNIQVLKGVPAEQLVPTMQFVASSLGVTCNFCHVQGANEKDEKDTKQTARKMMQMVMAINKDNFNGRVSITCYTCHRGSNMPVGTPVIADGSIRPSPGTTGAAGGGANPPQGPTAEQLLDKYIQAMGGKDALGKVTSRVAKGKIEDPANPPSPYEIYVKAPDKRLTVVRAPGNDSLAANNGSAGWTSSPGRGTRDMAAADAEGTQLEDDLFLATHAKQIYTQWRVGRPDKVGDRDAYVLNGTAPGHVPIRLYLDQQTGMLLRMMHFTETPLGRLPAQVDYSDYRDVDGVKVPYKLITARPTARNTVQLDQVQQNVPVEDSKFVKPAAPAQPR